MRTFLFNDIEFIGINPDESISSDNPLFSNYHTFKFIEKDSRKSVPNLTPIVGHDICKMFSAQAYHATSDHRHLKNIVDLITVIKDKKYSWLTEVK